MGQKPAKAALRRREIGEYMRMTHFNADEIRVLYEHFKSISSSEADDGVIDKREFQSALGFRDSAFVNRIFQLFDKNEDNAINFNEFICGLSVLSIRGTLEEKLQFSFQLYDLDGDNFISRDDLRRMLEASLIENDMPLSPSQVETLLDSTFQQTDLDRDGKINFEEYRHLVMNNPQMLNQLAVDMDDLLSDIRSQQSLDDQKDE